MSNISQLWKNDVKTLATGQKVNITTAIQDTYLSLLGRAPSMLEVANYINAFDPLSYATSTPAHITMNGLTTVVTSLVNSSEFQNKYASNGEYINYLYQAILERPADANGYAYWLNNLNHGGSRSAIAQSFIHSSEFSTTTGALDHTLFATQSSATQLWKQDLLAISQNQTVPVNAQISDAFAALLGGAPSATALTAMQTVAQAGMASTSSSINVQATSEANIINWIINSSDFTSAASNGVQFITGLYNKILGHDPDATGLQFWTNQLKSGVSPSDVAGNILSSNEFTAATGFNYYASLFSPFLNTLWQDGPESWSDPTTSQKAASQLKSLMGNSSNWTLVLDAIPQYSTPTQGGWTQDSIVTFMKDLKALNIKPTNIFYHPDLTSKDALGWFQFNSLGATPQPPQFDIGPAVFNASVNWMKLLNTALATDLPEYQFNGVVAEGDLLSDAAGNPAYGGYKTALNNAGFSNMPLWATGNWSQSNNKASTNGTYIQLYDYYPSTVFDQYFVKPDGTKYGTAVPTNPSDASKAGLELFTSLGAISPTNIQNVNSELFTNTKQTLLTLNFSGIAYDKPVFGSGDGTTAPWYLNSTYTLLSALENQAQVLSGSNAAPLTAIWSAESALDIFYQNTPYFSTSTVLTKTSGSNPFIGTIVYQPTIYTSSQTGKATLNIQIHDPNLKGVGLVPLFDNLGDIVAADGHLVTPNDPLYSDYALQNAIKGGAWQDVSSLAKADNASTSINLQTIQGHSYALVVQQANGVTLTSVGKNALGNPWIANSIQQGNNSIGLQLEGWNPLKGANFNDATVQISGLNSKSAVAALPIINVLWQDAAVWDTISAKQLETLISYKVTNPDGSVSYPNSGLQFIVSGLGPNSSAQLTSDAHKGVQGNSLFANSPSGLASFISTISSDVYKLTNGAVSWATVGGTGSVSYHPDMTVDQTVNGVFEAGDYNHDWANWSPKPPSIQNFTLPSSQSNAYQAVIDYSLYLNQALSSTLVSGSNQKLKGFNQVVFETESSGYSLNDLFGMYGKQNGLISKYPGNTNLLAENGGVNGWQSLFGATATAGPISNWSAQSNGYAANAFLAQTYDLLGSSLAYSPTWPSTTTTLDPGSVKAQQAATLFANFFVNTQPDPTPKAATTNINDMIPLPGNNEVIGGSYMPNAAFIFSYGPGGIANANHPKADPTVDQPIFQYGMFDSIGGSQTANAYRWDATSFASFVADFKTTLSQNLNLLTQNYNKEGHNVNLFPTTAVPNVGVWGGERALDAWFGVN